VAAGWKKQRPMKKRMVTEVERSLEKKRFLTGLTITYRATRMPGKTVDTGATNGDPSALPCPGRVSKKNASPSRESHRIQVRQSKSKAQKSRIPSFLIWWRFMGGWRRSESATCRSGEDLRLTRVERLHGAFWNLE
jgi:hypothetical protein